MKAGKMCTKQLKGIFLATNIVRVNSTINMAKIAVLVLTLIPTGTTDELGTILYKYIIKLIAIYNRIDPK